VTLEQEEAIHLLENLFLLITRVNPSTEPLFFTASGLDKGLTLAAWTLALHLDLTTIPIQGFKNLLPTEQERFVRLWSPSSLSHRGKRVLRTFGSQPWNTQKAEKTSLLDWLWCWNRTKKPEVLLMISMAVHEMCPISLSTLESQGRLCLPSQVYCRWAATKIDPINKAIALLAGAPRVFTYKEIAPHINRASFVRFLGPLWEELGCRPSRDREPNASILINGMEVSLDTRDAFPGETLAQALARQLIPCVSGSYSVHAEGNTIKLVAHGNASHLTIRVHNGWPEVTAS